MQGTRGSRAQCRRYRCGTRRRGGDCTQTIVQAEPLEEQLVDCGPPSDPDIAKAEALLEDFARFWEIEHDPAERRRLLGRLFDRIWQDGGTIVAVKPRAPFVRYFPSRRGRGVPKAGATGLEPAGGTPDRDSELIVGDQPP
jgi:hypothetical protein